MPPHRQHRPLHLRLAWLLWLALLLPAAQSAAAWHAVSHLGAEAIAQDHPAKPFVEHCALCLAGAALDGPPLPALAPAPAATAPGQLLPQRWQQAGALSPARLAYRSRAPPTAAC